METNPSTNLWNRLLNQIWFVRDNSNKSGGYLHSIFEERSDSKYRNLKR